MQDTTSYGVGCDNHMTLGGSMVCSGMIGLAVIVWCEIRLATYAQHTHWLVHFRLQYSALGHSGTLTAQIEQSLILLSVSNHFTSWASTMKTDLFNRTVSRGNLLLLPLLLLFLLKCCTYLTVDLLCLDKELWVSRKHQHPLSGGFIKQPWLLEHSLPPH